MGLNFIGCFSFGDVNTSAKNANENEDLPTTYWAKYCLLATLGVVLAPVEFLQIQRDTLKSVVWPQLPPPPSPQQMKKVNTA